jgi:hypothetical protein
MLRRFISIIFYELVKRIHSKYFRILQKDNYKKRRMKQRIIMKYVWRSFYFLLINPDNYFCF